MPLEKTMQKYLILLAVLAASTFGVACGGDGGDDSGHGANALPLVEGLQSDADNQRLLYYISTAQEAPGLYAYDPSQPEAGGILVDGDLSLRMPHAASLFAGEIGPGGDTISDYYVSDIFYTAWGTPQTDDLMASPIMYGEQWRVSTDPATLGDGPVRVSSTTLNSAIIAQANRFHTFDILDPMNSSALIQSTDGWVRVRMGYDAGRPADTFGEDVKVVSPVWGPDVQTNAGWIVFDRAEDSSGREGVLRRLDDELQPVEEIRYKDSGEVVHGVKQAKYIHDRGDDTVFLAVGVEHSEWGEVYLYEGSDVPGDGGTIKRLLNKDGQPLVISFAPMGIDESGGVSVSPPASGLTSVQPSGFYFAQGPSMFDQRWTHLFRLDSDGWVAFDHEAHKPPADSELLDQPYLASMLGGFLIEVAEDKLFWSLGENNEVVDVSSPDPAGWTRTPIKAAGGVAEGTTVFASANGWVYYNTGDDEAVLLNVDSGESVALKDAKWLGASSKAQIDALNSLQISRPISEVFLLQNGRKLAAVAAADPTAGMVPLGELAPNTEEVRLFGAASGPHRLAQVEYDDGTFEVVYMNTRRAESLKSLMPAPASDWSKPFSYTVSGQQQHTQVDIFAADTRPLDGF